MPKPGTKSFPLGTSGLVTGAFWVVVMDCPVCVDTVDELVVDIVVAGVSTVVVIVVISCTTTGSGAMIGAVVTWLITLFGFNGLIGLTGLAMLLILSTVILQVSNIVDHDVQVGEPYGSEHIE